MERDVSIVKETTADGNLTGKDPQTGQFVAGNSFGQGRQEGSRNFSTIYKAALQKVAESNGQSLNDVEDNLVKVAIEKAQKGDFKFYQDLMDRLNGKPVQRTENTNLSADLHKLKEEEKQRLDELIK